MQNVCENETENCEYFLFLFLFIMAAYFFYRKLIQQIELLPSFTYEQELLFSQSDDDSTHFLTSYIPTGFIQKWSLIGSSFIFISLFSIEILRNENDTAFSASGKATFTMGRLNLTLVDFYREYSLFAIGNPISQGNQQNNFSNGLRFQ